MSLQVGVWGDPQVIGASIAELCALYGLTVWTSPRRFLLGTVAVTVAVLAAAAAAAQTLSSTAVALSEHLAWYADLAAHVHGAHTLTIKRVELLISDSPSDPTAAPSLVQQGLSASHKPFRLTLGRNGKWDGTLGSGGQPLPGTYGSLEIGYNVDGHDGTHIFPALARPSGFPH